MRADGKAQSTVRSLGHPVHSSDSPRSTFQRPRMTWENTVPVYHLSAVFLPIV